MAIKEHPKPGTLLLCDFNQGFREPEMVKRRPVVVLTPRIIKRPGLCTVVALSTTAPDHQFPYHCEVELNVELPPPFNVNRVWIKGDMVNAVGLHRLDFFRRGKDIDGKRIYVVETLNDQCMKQVRRCVLHGLGLSTLTKHL